MRQASSILGTKLTFYLGYASVATSNTSLRSSSARFVKEESMQTEKLRSDLSRARQRDHQGASCTMQLRCHSHSLCHSSAVPLPATGVGFMTQVYCSPHYEIIIFCPLSHEIKLDSVEDRKLQRMGFNCSLAEFLCNYKTNRTSFGGHSG